MRTLDELSHAPWECEQNREDHVRVTVAELRHLLAIARAAGANCFDCAKCAVGERLQEARDAGIFENKGEGR
jgi:hypothetical protein